MIGIIAKLTYTVIKKRTLLESNNKLSIKSKAEHEV